MIEIRDDIVGTRLGTHRREVTWRDTMNYAAAVGDDRPDFFDDSRADPLAVHPLFPVAISWPYIEGMAERWGQAIPAEVIPRMVHAAEHLKLHRPLVPGDELELDGRIVAVLPNPAGTMVYLGLKAKDAHGRDVYEETIGGLFRQVPCAGDGRGAEDLPAAMELAPAAGQGRWMERLRISPLAAHVYDGCTGIFFPIHTSRAVARFVGLEDILLQGTATLALAVSQVMRREWVNPRSVVEVSCSFRRPVVPGQEVIITCFDLPAAAKGEGFAFEVENEKGQKAIQNGVFRIRS